MATSKKEPRERNPQWQQRKDSNLPDGFLAAMRFNAMQRGMKWRDTYELTSDVATK